MESTAERAKVKRRAQYGTTIKCALENTCARSAMREGKVEDKGQQKVRGRRSKQERRTKRTLRTSTVMKERKREREREREREYEREEGALCRTQ